MKAPLLNRTQRWFLKECSEASYSARLRVDLAIANLKQAFGKSWFIQKVIKPLVDHLSKALQAR